METIFDLVWVSDRKDWLSIELSPAGGARWLDLALSVKRHTGAMKEVAAVGDQYVLLDRLEADDAIFDMLTLPTHLDNELTDMLGDLEPDGTTSYEAWSIVPRRTPIGWDVATADSCFR